MSKSLGNVVDPLQVMEEFGTDALRFTLLTGGTPGNDLNLSLAKVESNRNFANKIWNVARFVVQNLDRATPADAPAADETPSYTAADAWILTRLSELVTTADRLYDGYQYGEAGRQIYDFFWSDFADWAVESAKVELAHGGRRAWVTLSVLVEVLDVCLRLLHPFVPFVTEETWQQVKVAVTAADLGIRPKGGWEEALIIADWPQPGPTFPALAADYERLREVVREIRAVRAEYKVPPGRLIPATLVAGTKAGFFTAQRPVLAFLARLDEGAMTVTAAIDPPAGAVTISLGDVVAYLPLAGLVDLDQERARLEGELAEVRQQVGRLQTLLQGEFAGRAPAQVVAREREKLSRFEASRRELEERLAALG
jgi:valyl-tRNA synthetase